ncbi:DUF547 domain-containing protein [Neolewinella sp.]|uniref:DUF547 domain-containing protein n=1 Tax=Neolewinella sp. TaxID=2993543 RepID=UPI003B51B3CE
MRSVTMATLPSLPTCLLLLLLLTTTSCADGPPPPAASTTQTADLGTLPITEDTVASDQIEYTLEKNPEVPPNDAPQRAVAPAPTPVAPPPPTNAAPASPPPPAPVEASSPAVSSAPDHTAWDELLRKHVSAAGRVDYVGFQRDAAALDTYLTTLAEETPGEDWSRDESLAYWINTYNAYTIKLILDNWPLESIRDINEPWDKKWIALAGKTYSLNQIEHEIIRPTYREPRIHFALVCAARSCPPLPNQAFTAQNLNELLDQRARGFINDEALNVTQEEVVRVSPIFDWYGQDFGEVREYLNKYLTTDIPDGKEINYLDYDWSLNN